MTPEQLEAHRVRFEQQSGEPETMKGQRRGDGYANHSDTRTWQAYQCGIADADRAQRGGQPPQQSAQPVAYRAWFDEDHGARWLFTLWPDEERLEVDWQPLYAAAQPVEVRRVQPVVEISDLLDRYRQESVCLALNGWFHHTAPAVLREKLDAYFAAAQQVEAQHEA